MITGKASVEVRGPGVKPIEDNLKKLAKASVLVGVPADHASRRGGKINNAELAFIQSHGSPIRGIPPRPFLEPSIEHNKRRIAQCLRKAALAALKGDKAGMARQLKISGMIGATGARSWFTHPLNGWPPLSPATIKAKGSDRPLIDTGQLRNSVTYVLRGLDEAGALDEQANEDERMRKWQRRQEKRSRGKGGKAANSNAGRMAKLEREQMEDEGMISDAVDGMLTDAAEGVVADAVEEAAAGIVLESLLEVLLL